MPFSSSGCIPCILSAGASPRGSFLPRLAISLGSIWLADGVHGVHVGFVEEHGHVVPLFHADAVFAGDGAAKIDAQFEDFACQRFRMFEGTLGAAVVQNQRVEIAIPRMEDVGHVKAICLAEAVNLGQRFAQMGAGNHAVLHHVIGAEPADGRKVPLCAPSRFWLVARRFRRRAPRRSRSHG